MTDRDVCSTAEAGEPAVDTAFMAGGGKMGALIRSRDWENTPLGPISKWPQSLRTAVSICINSRFPIVLFWGQELVMIYNDAYLPMTGAKHPRSLGQPGLECWAEVRDVVGPMLLGVLTQGDATWSEDLMLPLDRGDGPKEAYFTFAYSPITDESRGVGGVFCAVVETTERVIQERRLRLLNALADTTQAKTPGEACALAAAQIARAPSDTPFALLYLLDEVAGVARLAGSANIESGGQLSPTEIRFGRSSPWPFEEAASKSGSTLVALDAGPGGTKAAVVLPVERSGSGRRFGFIVAGLSPVLRKDAAYDRFHNLLSASIAQAVNNAAAYEEERRRADALAEIDRVKTTFFSNVSHEFRTPLTLMLGPIDDMRALPPRDPEDRERVDLLHRNALRLLKLVNTLLDFSRIEAGRTDAAYEPTDLSGLTADLASSFRSAIEKAGLTLDVDCPPLPETFHVDPGMWEKIVLNLLSNAFKFTFEGTITVRLRAVQNGAVLEVADTGIGIAENDLPRIFERFHRIEGAHSRSHEGSGIGLALVQELVRLHGGELRVQSQRGVGTSFFVCIPVGASHLPKDRLQPSRTLPRTSTGAGAYVEEALRWVSEPADPAPPSIADRAESEPRERILVVDDNADMRDYLARLLRERWDVDATGNGQVALERIRRNPPDLVITDVMMPGLDGFALLRALRNDAATREIPVVMLSARAGEEATSDGLRAGADDYLVKPFTARELFVRVAARLTAVKAAREASAQRANLYRAFMQAPFPVAIFRGPNHVIELANAATLRAWGHTPNIIGRPLLEARPELREQPYPQLLDEVYRTGTTHEGREQLARLPTGPAGEFQDRHFNFVYAPLFDARGGVEGIMVCSFEVTEQVRAQTLLTTAQKIGQIGIFEWDGRSNEVYWSPELYALLGRLPGELEPTVEHWNELQHAEDREAGWQKYRDACANRTTVYESEQRLAGCG